MVATSYVDVVSSFKPSPVRRSASPKLTNPGAEEVPH
jgi:hypothetical protein